MKKTPRGFKIFSEFTDNRNNRIQVQESSAACGPRCWIFIDGGPDTGAMHLTKAQARRLITALFKFLEAP